MSNELTKIKSLQELGVTLTALEIHNREFSHRFRGYCEDEVNEFLDQIIKDYEAFGRIVQDLQRENARLREEAPLAQNNLEGILERLREVEIYCWGQPKG
ncbi:DivIVA domain-containing protein [Paenibacillus taichungensis]